MIMDIYKALVTVNPHTNLLEIPATIFVLEQDKGPIPTGLVDQHGTMTYRLTETVPVGFRLR